MTKTGKGVIMSNLLGLYIIKKDVNDVRMEISQIMKNYKVGLSVFEEKVASKRYCEMTWRLLENYFEPGMCGVEKCKRLLKPYKDSDDINLLRIGKNISDEILLELSSMMNNTIPLKDFPSCKEILNCSTDIAVECVKDMANSKFAKIGIGLVSLLSKGKDTVTAVDVWNFYFTIKKELEREMHEESWVLSPVEQELYYKAKAECGYCFKAMLKTGFGIVHELKGIIDEATADDDIRQFEERNARSQTSALKQYSSSGINLIEPYGEDR